MEEIFARLEKLKKFANRLPMSRENKEDFISYCAQAFLEGRDIRTKSYFLYVDYMRMWCGRSDKKASKYELTVHHKNIENQYAVCEEDNWLARILAQKVTRKLLRLLPVEESIIIKMIYIDEIPLDEVGKIFGLCASRMSQKKSLILKKMKSLAVLKYRM